MTGRESLAALLRERSVTHGDFVLSSGTRSTYYIDARKTTMSAEGQQLIGPVALAAIRKAGWAPAAVGGLTMGADPVAGAMLHAAAASGRQLDAFVVRKAAKAHGLQKRVEGPEISGRRVLVVEDTSTTGGSPLEALAAVREAGAVPVGVATIADRDTGAGAKIEAEGVPYLFAYSLDDLGLR